MLRPLTLAAGIAIIAASPAQARHAHRHHHHHARSHHRVHHGSSCGHLATIRARSGASACVAYAAAPRFQALVGALEARGYPIAFMGGWRAHGSVRHSLHPFGLALDINQTGRNRVTHRFPRDLIAIAHRCGLTSGSEWANADTGHFEMPLYARWGRRVRVAYAFP